MRILRSAAVVVATAILAACSAEHAVDDEPTAVDPCGHIGPACTAAGAGNVSDGTSLQGIGVVEGVDGSAELRVAFGDARGVRSAVVPRAAYVYSESVTRDVELYDLDAKPGHEIVVGRGTDGTHAWFGVYTFDGTRLVQLRGPRDVVDPRTGMWRLLVGEKQGQIVCRDDGRITAGSAPLGDDYFACRDELITDVTFRKPVA
ncbi:MAG: hypothetical protein LBE07_08645 [Gordonia sp. (in: high G+C Gram-positive bacteria)]|nr:hypothetical protein [Gordonia sp. (in: high G+C Gram-positive bacteria)]